MRQVQASVQNDGVNMKRFPLLSPAECQMLMEVSREWLTDAFRTSYAAHRSGFKLHDDCTASLKIRQKCQELSGLPLRNIEPVEVVRYQVGASYQVHTDGWWRDYTLLVYLNDGYEGGETWFPELGGAVEPKAGDAIAWQNARNGVLINEHRHGVHPLIAGEKWAAVCWGINPEYRYDPDVISGVQPSDKCYI